MRIAIVDVAASTSGALSVLNDFYIFVRDNYPEHEWLFLVGTPEFKECSNIQVVNVSYVKKSWLHRLVWEFINAAGVIKAFQPDVVISLQNLRVPNLSVPQLVYIHQPIPFQKEKQFSFFNKDETVLAVYQYLIGGLIWHTVRKADGIVVQTQWMKQAILAKLPQAANRIRVILPLVGEIQTSPVVWQNGKLAKVTRFFYPAIPLKYKNHVCIIKAVRQLAKQGITNFEVLFTINGTEGHVARELYKEAAGLEKYIRFVGYLDRISVLEEYCKSVLIFPSYIETFGYPLLEARQAKGIIIASDCSFSREILDGYENVSYFNPFNSDELAKNMKDYIEGRHMYVKPLPVEVNTGGWAHVVEHAFTLVKSSISDRE